MQGVLFEGQTAVMDMSYVRAAIRECIAYGEHGLETEIDDAGLERCFNCQGRL